MTKAEMFSKYLTAEGYAPKIDADGDISFKYEGLTYCIFASENDKEFFRLALPNFWGIDTEDERRRALVAANEATASVKVGKVFLVQDNVWASVELLVDPIEGFDKVFRRSLNIIGACIRSYRDKMMATTQ